MMVILIQRDIGMEDEASKSPSSKTLDFVFYFFFFFFIKMKKKKKNSMCVYIYYKLIKCQVISISGKQLSNIIFFG
jgi:hypothetical protein